MKEGNAVAGARDPQGMAVEMMAVVDSSRCQRPVWHTSIYVFTTWNAALIYGLVLILVVFGAWLLCGYYREHAQETVIHKQAQEVIRERDYYYNQIQDYKRNNSKYARLFSAYDKNEFLGQFNKP